MIFTESVARLPDHYSWATKFIETMWASAWFPTEFSFTKDKHEFLTVLTEEERGVITRTLVAISQIEIAVKKFWSRLGDNLPHPSLVDLGLVMAASEVVHNRAYEKLLVVLGLQDAFADALKLDVIARRVAYLRKYLDKPYKDARKQYVYSLVLFTLFTESVSLFSQFYVMLSFNRHKNTLKDVAQQVNYTKGEETIHAMVGVKLIHAIRDEHPELFDAEMASRVLQESVCAYEAEAGIVDWILGGYEMDGLTAPLLKNFVKARLNSALGQIGFAAPFALDADMVRQTLWFEEEVWAPAMTDFFSKRPVDYSKEVQGVDSDDLF